MDFNKIIQRGKELDQFEKDKNEIEATLEVELGGKEVADYKRSSYSETPIKAKTTENKEIDHGDMLSISELEENVRFEKMVLLKTYSTQTNRFDKFKADIIFTFVDRNGIEVKSRAFGELDTSNQVSYSNKLKALSGDVVWLEGRLIRRGERHFIDVIKVKECPLDQTIAREAFKVEVSSREDLVKKVWAEISKYPLSYSLYGQYEQVLSQTPIKDIYERRGGYLYYLNYLIELVDKTPLNKDIKDKVISFDIVGQLKQWVNNLELTKILGQLAVSKYDERFSEEIVNDVLFKVYTDPSVYELIGKDLKRGISTLILLEDWSKWEMNYVYSNMHKMTIAINREV